MRSLILLLEDDPAFRDWVTELLPKDRFVVETAVNGWEGLDFLAHRKPDLILLDWNLPGWSGLEICRYLKQNKPTRHIPLMMLTCHHEVQRKVLALEAGVEDYLAKPFDIEELVARIKAILRSQHLPAAEEVFSSGGIQLNVTSHSVDVDRKPLVLTATEFNLLCALMKGAGRVLSRKYLLENVWGYAMEVSTRTVDVYVRRLRRKLGRKQAERIQTYARVGYKFISDHPSPGFSRGLAMHGKIKSNVGVPFSEILPVYH